MREGIRLSKIILFFLLLSVISIFSQSLNSLTGYYNIPTAEINQDKKIVTGAFYIPYKFSKEKGFDKDAIGYFGAISYLPFLEMSLRFTKLLGHNYALGDRMFSFKLRFISEGKYYPSFAIGAQDFFHSTENLTNRYNSLYLVTTKSVETNTFLNKMSITLGYGSDIIPANGYEYIGVFGGVSFTFFNHLEIMGEYDARNYNIGSRIKLFDSIFLLGGFRDLKYFSGGGGIYFQL